MSTASTPLLVSYREAARLLGGVSVAHIGRLARAGKLKPVGQGKGKRIRYDSILRYIESEDGNG